MKLIKAVAMRWVVWIWKHTPDCAEMSSLASRSLDESLPLRLRLQMKLHFLICVWCKRYSRQLRFLHHAAPHLPPDNPGARGLSANAKHRIAEQLRASA